MLLTQLSAAQVATHDASFVGTALKALGALVVIVGFVAAVQQLWSAAGRRKYRAAEERMLEVMEKSIDAENAERDAEHFELLRSELRKQVEEEVPREARRVYLRSRLDALQNQLASEIEEYDSVRKELGAWVANGVGGGLVACRWVPVGSGRRGRAGRAAPRPLSLGCCLRARARGSIRSRWRPGRRCGAA